jgi:WD40 repeat protein
MNRARFDHTATLLPNGQVLVAGGYDTNYVSRAELYHPATGTWTMTGTLNIPRSSHTATLLPSGKVLVAGGEIAGNASTATAELYDPATGLWTRTGSLHAARDSHTAILLFSGKVLIAGGQDRSSSALVTAELYDLVSGTWTPTGSMITNRAYFTATLLPNGKVLATGGDGGDASSAELYDPTTGMWTLTGPMSDARTSHTATLLPSGQVLVAGGLVPTLMGAAGLYSAELYDPATGAWSATGSLGMSRASHTATLLPDGRVLACGGEYYDAFGDGLPIASAEQYNPATGTWGTTGELTTTREEHTATLLDNGEVLVAGGLGESSAELYDRTRGGSGGWSMTGSMNDPRVDHPAVLLTNGQVLVTGSGVGPFCAGACPVPLSTTELYDPAFGTWTWTGAMNTPREAHTATLLTDGTVLVAGGDTGLIALGSNLLSSAEIYDPVGGSWMYTGWLNGLRELHTATLLTNGQVLVAGGWDGSGNMSSAELYDPAAGTWTLTGSLNTPRSSHTVALLLNGQVLVAGGMGDSSTELYDPVSASWTVTGPMSSPRHGHTMTMLAGGKVLVTGGNSGSGVLGSAELYDPATGLWTLTGALNTARVYHSATVLANGQVLVAGGHSSANYLSSAEIYDPATGRWTLIAPLNIARSQHTAVRLPNGEVLVSGGFISDYSSPYETLSAELYDPGAGITPAAIRAKLIKVRKLANGSFQFAFTNTPGASFTVLVTSFLSLPLPDWMVLRGVTETSPGQFQFTDPQTTNSAQRFYRLRSP